MNIAIIGYGKMGKEIEKIAQERGHTIVATLQQTPSGNDLAEAEVAIEFTRPATAFENIEKCIENGTPVVCGTTGWLDRKSEIEASVKKNNGSFIYASNYSLGVNLFFEMTRKMAQMMNSYPNYSIEMEEIHHTQKKDAPSGTAISLAEIVIEESDYENWNLNIGSEPNCIPIEAKRIDDVPGTHSLRYISKEDEIELKHTAHSRRGFALGAVIAAEYIYNKKGIFTMKEVLGLD